MLGEDNLRIIIRDKTVLGKGNCNISEGGKSLNIEGNIRVNEKDESVLNKGILD